MTIKASDVRLVSESAGARLDGHALPKRKLKLKQLLVQFA